MYIHISFSNTYFPAPIICNNNCNVQKPMYKTRICSSSFCIVCISVTYSILHKGKRRIISALYHTLYKDCKNDRRPQKKSQCHFWMSCHLPMNQLQSTRQISMKWYIPRHFLRDNTQVIHYFPVWTSYKAWFWYTTFFAVLCALDDPHLHEITTLIELKKFYF